MLLVTKSQHRKTGITLKDTGIRDEHGMEPLEGVFSSPEKSPAKRSSSSRRDATITTSEEMDIDESACHCPDAARVCDMPFSIAIHDSYPARI